MQELEKHLASIAKSLKRIAKSLDRIANHMEPPIIEGLDVEETIMPELFPGEFSRPDK